MKHYFWSLALYGVENWTLCKADQKYLECFKMWCWRMTGKVSWTDLVRNEKVLHRVTGKRNILHILKRRKANWLGHSLRRNCLIKHIIEEKTERGIEVTGRRERRRKRLLDDLKERRGYGKLKEEALDRTLWRSRLGRGYGPVVRQSAELMDEYFEKIISRIWASRKEALEDMQDGAR
jgi:hypothetical protein